MYIRDKQRLPLHLAIQEVMDQAMIKRVREKGHNVRQIYRMMKDSRKAAWCDSANVVELFLLYIVCYLFGWEFTVTKCCLLLTFDSYIHRWNYYTLWAGLIAARVTEKYEGRRIVK